MNNDRRRFTKERISTKDRFESVLHNQETDKSVFRSTNWRWLRDNFFVILVLLVFCVLFVLFKFFYSAIEDDLKPTPENELVEPYQEPSSGDAPLDYEEAKRIFSGDSENE